MIPVNLQNYIFFHMANDLTKHIAISSSVDKPFVCRSNVNIQQYSPILTSEGSKFRRDYGVAPEMDIRMQYR